MKITYIAFFSCLLLAIAESDKCFAMIVTPTYKTFPIDGNTTDKALLPDSLLTEEYIYEYTFSDFDKAIRIIEEMRKRSLLPVHRLDIAEGDLYFNTGRYNKALVYYRRALENDSVRNNNTDYMDQLHRMVSSYDCLHDEVRQAQYVELLLQKTKACGDIPMQSVALFNLGKMLYYQEDKERGYRFIQEGIGLMKHSDYKYKYDNLRYNYNTLLIMQQRDHKYQNALETLDRLAEVATEATHNEPPIQGLAEKERKTLYAQRALVLSKLGKTQEAEEAYNQWREIGKKYSKDDYLITPYLMERKQYDEVIQLHKARERFLRKQNDTINYHMMTILRSLGQAYAGKGNYRKSKEYFENLAILTDSLKMREQKSAAIGLATVYETNEKETQIRQQDADLKVRSLLLTSAGGAILLLMVFLWRNIYYIRTIKHKNAAMIGNIEELLTYKDELLLKRKEIRLLKEENAVWKRMQVDVIIEGTSGIVSTNAGVAIGMAGTTPHKYRMDGNIETNNSFANADINEKIRYEMNATAAMEYEKENEQPKENEQSCSGEEEEQREESKMDGDSWMLFEKLEDVVVNEKLFVNSNLSRDELMKQIGVDKNRFGQIIQQCAHTNVTTYINHKRLEYATRLLKKYPNYTVSAIAQSCGIPNIPTFNRLFKEKHGMTPSDFKKGLHTS